MLHQPLHIVQWFVPRMPCQGEFRMVHRDGLSRSHIPDCLFQLSGHGVNIPPRFIILPIFQYSQVDVSMLLTYVSKMCVITSVAADIDF